VHGQAQAQGHGGFFIPARSSKISIRAPGDHDKAEMSEGGVVDGPGGYASIASPPLHVQGQGQGYYPGYNPYAGAGYGQDYGGGVSGEASWQGYNGVQAGYGYDEYPGY
jgi:hypothetical protein